MFKVITYTILKKRLCKETSVVGKGENIILYKDGYSYKTAMLEPNGTKYWIKSFTSLEKATIDFYDIVDSRILCENIMYY